MNLRSSTTVLITGALAVVFGLFALFTPVDTAMALVTVIGAFMLATGVLEAVMALRAPRGARGWGLWSGVLTALVGLVGLFAPAVGATAVIWIISVWLIVRGVFSLVGAFAIRGPGRGTGILAGILWIVLAVVLVTNPVAATATLSFRIGLLALFAGLAMLGVGFFLRKVGNTVRDAQAGRGAFSGTAPRGYGQATAQQRRSPLDTGDVIEGETK